MNDDPMPEIMKAILDAVALKDLSKSIDVLTGQLSKRHRSLESYEDVRYDIGEYCYHLVSILNESRLMLLSQDFSANYIEEHCNTLSRYAKIIGKEISSYE